MPALSFELPENIPAALARTALEQPKRGIAIFDRRGTAYERVEYRELHRRFCRAAASLRAQGVQAGEVTLVCLPTSWSWLDCWFGALYLGAYPVAVAPAGAIVSAQAVADKLNKLVTRFEVKHLFCDSGLIADLDKGTGEKTAFAIAKQMPSLSLTDASAFEPIEANSESLAFLQLTSGSTGFQRAVAISHLSALHNSHAIGEAVSATESGTLHDYADNVVSWLPLYHDMGLIGCLIFTMQAGLDLWLMRPETFLARPQVWLHRLGSHGRSLSPAPNFAYQSCIDRLACAEISSFDLRTWKAAMTGAEMIRPETIHNFCNTFAKAGFRSEAFRPCYGLAEGTLAVTFDRKGQGARFCLAPSNLQSGQTEVVSTGTPIADTQVEVVAPNGISLAEGQIGEVRARGPGIFMGYYRDEAATREALQAGWLVTGDLGFMRAGELYITGRTKELLIVNGHNIMPHELEWIAEGIAGGGGSERCGAFSISRGRGEQAVLVMEAPQSETAQLEQLAHEIKIAIGRQLSLPLADFVFVKRGSIPKTTSGKVQRGILRERYLAGQLQQIRS